MKTCDLVILLGSQIKKISIFQRGLFRGCEYILAPHTKLKAEAAGIAWQKRIAGRFIISGGHNFNVRYSAEEILKEPDFSFNAVALGQREKSEAEVITEFLKREYGIPTETLFLEEVSTTTEENAEILKILLKRTPTFTFAKKIAILTLVYHMEKALPVFQKVGLEAEPLFAEDLLALEGESGIEKVCQYYAEQHPKTYPKQKQWPVDKIREILSNGRSIGELIEK